LGALLRGLQGLLSHTILCSKTKIERERPMRTDVSLGTLVIDWKNRTVEVTGMNGCEKMTPAEAAAIVGSHEQDETKWAAVLMFRHDNEQLACQDVAGMFADLEDVTEPEPDPASDTDLAILGDALNQEAIIAVFHHQGGDSGSVEA
jgi:hypothetical protein